VADRTRIRGASLGGRGKSDAQIGAIRASARTVQKHRQNIYDKLG
jgi:DNA-binding CsgD family transcriptional regulator